MKKIYAVIIAALVLALSACTTFTASNLAFGRFDGEVVGTFDTSVTVWKYIGSAGGATLFDLGQDKTDTAIKHAIRDELFALGADAAIDVTIEQEASFFDFVINSITSDFLAPVTIHISGTAIKF